MTLEKNTAAEQYKKYFHINDDTVEFRHVYYPNSPPDDPPIGVLQKHNVRVLNTSSNDIEFLGACKFDDGFGSIREGHETLGIVKKGIGIWQVELVDGK